MRLITYILSLVWDEVSANIYPDLVEHTVPPGPIFFFFSENHPMGNNLRNRWGLTTYMH